MAKDPVRNVDRKKIRGGQFNDFDFARHHRQEDESGQTGGIPVNSEQVRADRIKRLLAKYGASVPGEKKVDPDIKPAPVSKPEPRPALSEKKVEPETKSMPASLASTPVLREDAEPVTKTVKKPANPAKSIKTAKSTTTRSAGKATSKAATEKAKPGAKAKSSSTTRARSTSAPAKKAAAKGRSPGARKSTRPSR